MKTFQSLLLIAMLTAALPALAGAPDDSPVLPFPGTDNIPGDEASSALVRYARSLRIDVKTSGLDAGSPYTLWAVIFNAPKFCKTRPCSMADLPLSPGHDPRVEASIVFAGGGVADYDGSGRFRGRVRKSGGRVTGELILGTGSLDPRRAEVHVVVRGHGYPPAEAIFDALNSFAGGCDAGNACEDQQFAVHLPTTVK